jgi:hypothetical protein
MYHPLPVYDAEDGSLVTMLLPPGNTHSARGALGVLTRQVAGSGRAAREPKLWCAPLVGLPCPE